jgi:hypothetical protein
VAREQWFTVGVSSTVRRFRGEDVPSRSGDMCMSGRLTTAREPSERGCSGSEIGDIRSYLLASRIICS